MIVLRNKEYSFRATRAIAKSKLLLNKLRRNKKSRQTILREAIDVQNKKVIPTAAKVKTKIDATKLKATNPIGASAEVAHNITGQIAKNPVVGFNAAPTGTLAHAKLWERMGLDPASALGAGEVSSLATAAATKSAIKYGRKGSWKFGRWLSNSSMKPVRWVGDQIRGGLIKGRKLNNSYVSGVNQVLNDPGRVIKSTGRYLKAGFIGGDPRYTMINRRKAVPIFNTPLTQGIGQKYTNVVNRVKGYIPSFRIPEPTFELAPSTLSRVGF